MFEWLFDLVTMNKYVSSIAIFIAFYAFSEVVIFVSEKILLKITKKTKTNVDDILVNKTKKPVSLLLLGIGVKLALLPLSLEGRLGFILAKLTSSFITITVIYLITVVINVLIKFWGERFAAKTESTLDDHIVAFISKATTIASLIIILLFILKIWGIEIGPLLAGLGIGGIAIAFAMQKSLSNIFGGISLILDKSINVGDTVYIDAETRGKILDIGLRSTKIRTFDNEVVIIPNGKLEEMKIQNIVKPDPSARVVIPFGVAYGTDIDKVKKVVVNEIYKIKGLKKEPEPLVRFTEMADSALILKAYFWMESYSERFRAKDEANSLIYKALNKNKISIPFPQMDVHLKKR